MRHDRYARARTEHTQQGRHPREMHVAKHNHARAQAQEMPRHVSDQPEPQTRNADDVAESRRGTSYQRWSVPETARDMPSAGL